FASTDASLVFTFEFPRMPFSVLAGYLLFGETIDLWTWVGALIIFTSAVYVTRREAQLARHRQRAEQQTPSNPEPQPGGMNVHSGQSAISAQGSQSGDAAGTGRPSLG